MGKYDVFEGDLRLRPATEGVDLEIQDDLFVCDRGFGTAVFLSLFGGNKNDAGKVEDYSGWWGNYIDDTPANEKLVSKFQNVLTSMPMTSQNIKIAEEAAAQDLQWFKDEDICDEIIVSGRATGIKSFKLIVSLNKSGTSLFQTEYPLQWEAGLNGI